MVISKIKLNKFKQREVTVDGIHHLAFRIGSVPKRFGMTSDELQKISHIPGMKKTSIRSWINYKGYVLIDSRLLNGRDFMHTNW